MVAIFCLHCRPLFAKCMIIYWMSLGKIKIPFNWLAFKKQEALVYTKNYATGKSVQRISVGRLTSMGRCLSEDTRKDRMDHYLDNGPARRCCANCRRKTKLLCIKCQLNAKNFMHLFDVLIRCDLFSIYCGHVHFFIFFGKQKNVFIP